jgi:hypothetical protein
MIFEVAIGILLIYLVLAVVSSAVTELVSQMFNLRSEGLWATVRQMLHDPEGTGIAKDLYNHSLISEGKAPTDQIRKPSSIKPRIFSVALISQLGGDQYSNENLLEGLSKEGELSKAIRPLVEAAGTDPKRAHRNIETWFESAIQRATEWYARQTRFILAFVGLLLAFVCNADTLMLVQGLGSNPAAQVKSQSQAKATAPVRSSSAETRLEPKPIPAGVFGWSGPSSASDPAYNANDPRRFPSGLWPWGMKLLGLALTGLAVSMIAPCLYNLFRRLGHGLTGTKAARVQNQAPVPEAFASKPEPVLISAPVTPSAMLFEEEAPEAEAVEEALPVEVEPEPAPVEVEPPAAVAPVKAPSSLHENVEVISSEDIMALLNSPDPIELSPEPVAAPTPAAVAEPIAPAAKEEDGSALASADEIAAILAAANAAPSPEPVAKEEDDSGIASADEIAALLAAANAGPAPEPVAKEEDDSGIASADEIAALLAAANAGPTPEAVAKQEDDSAIASADEIAAMLAAASTETAPASADNFASQDEISRLLEEAMNSGPIVYPELEEEPERANPVTEDLGAVSAEEIDDLFRAMKENELAEAAAASPVEAPKSDDSVALSSDDIAALLESMKEASPTETESGNKEAA